MEKTSYSEKIAQKSLEMGAIRLSPQKPFCWASGYYMPIYNDNRTLLGVFSCAYNLYGILPLC